MPATVKRYTLTLPGLPALRIAVLADIHACAPWMTLRRIEAIVAQTNMLGADLIVLLGDYVGHVLFARQLPPRPVAGALARLQAPLGTFAVMGNHDWRGTKAGAADTPWHRAFEAEGIPVLQNAARMLDHDGGQIPLVGIDSQRAFGTPQHGQDRGADDLDRALSGLDASASAILLAHEPDIFPDLRDPVRLVLSGHTHGGQIRAFGRSWIVPSRYGRRYDWGHFQAEGRHMIVSGGLGFTGLPLRLSVPPEITLIELLPMSG